MRFNERSFGGTREGHPLCSLQTYYSFSSRRHIFRNVVFLFKILNFRGFIWPFFLMIISCAPNVVKQTITTFSVMRQLGNFVEIWLEIARYGHLILKFSLLVR